MSDRQLLEAAARAGGYTPVRWTDDGTALLLEGVQEPWNALHPNPHSDCMGDALRLAVKLNMQIVITGYELEGVGITDCKAGLGKWAGGSLHHSDPCAATCLAIVRAAAALTQPEGGA